MIFHIKKNRRLSPATPGASGGASTYFGSSRCRAGWYDGCLSYYHYWDRVYFFSLHLSRAGLNELILFWKIKHISAEVTSPSFCFFFRNYLIRYGQKKIKKGGGMQRITTWREPIYEKKKK